MKLSFAITSHNEGQYLSDLLNQLVTFVSYYERISTHTYEIVVVDDNSTDPLTQEVLYAYEMGYPGIVFHYKHELNKNFAAHKNFLNSMCTGDWILQLDADERISDDFLTWIPDIILANPDVEAYWLPRVNTVEGLTLDHVRRWGWVLTTMDEFRQAKVIDPSSAEYELLKAYKFIISEENGFVTHYQPIIQWPDPQMRLYKNDPKIKWERPVHEYLSGFTDFSHMPMQLDFAIRHHKEIKRQEQQNALYATFAGTTFKNMIIVEKNVDT